MKAREYLSQIKEISVKLQKKERELADLQARATAIGSFDYSKNRVQTSPPAEAPFARSAERVAELEAELEHDIIEYVDLVHRITSEILDLEDPRYMEILFRRYVEFISLKNISKAMGYSYEWTRHLHHQALQEFERQHAKTHL